MHDTSTPPPAELAPRLTVSRRAWIAAAAWLAAIVAASLLDHVLWKWLKIADESARSAVERRDWYQALRQLGYWPVWIGVGVVLALIDRTRATADWARRGVLVIVSSGLGGLAAELLKLAIRRHRPGELGRYAFDWPMAAVKPPLGTVSSHAGVAFGAAFMLGRIFPASRWVLIPAACGTGLTRLLSGAHFSSDVVAGAAFAYALAELMWWRFGVVPRRNGVLSPDSVTP